MKKNSLGIFLTSFFALFKAHVKELEIKGDKVLGAIGWKDEEDEQKFSWVIVFKEAILLRLSLLCDFLEQHNLIQGDKIIIPALELKVLLQKNGWNLNESEAIIEKLCSVEIKMIDDGEETDSFFVHF
ncbi:MAG: hypothetical protein H7A32_04940 [Deltaproteobacteria bacterium]|nr:hypothetical protein [Deltaproteobacteria bacterium]